MLAKSDVAKIKKQLEKSDERLPVMFAALGDPGRFKIFSLLTKNMNICVSEFANILEISPSAASQALSYLELCGLVKRQRNGQMICYRINKEDATVMALVRLMKK